MVEIFNSRERSRYSRHFIIPNFGIESQQRLKLSKVLVVGVGGLGCPLLTYLAAAGVGTIGMVDFDIVEESNLHRQVLFQENDIGKLKVDAALKHLKSLNSFNNYIAYPEKLTSKNAIDIFSNYDIIVDGTDNFPTRYLVNDCCVFLGKPNVYGSIFQFEGQVSVFNYKSENDVYGPNYRDLYDFPPPPDLVPSCAESGVLGVLPGIIGSLQANEVIKIVTGIGKPLSGRLFVFDALCFEARMFNIKRKSDNPLTGSNPSIYAPIDYELFCGLNFKDNVKQITAIELYNLKTLNKDFQLIDVREQSEYNALNINGESIPLPMLLENVDKISRDKLVVIHCMSGARSLKAIHQLQEKYGLTNLYNLSRGMMEYYHYIKGRND